MANWKRFLSVILSGGAWKAYSPYDGTARDFVIGTPPEETVGWLSFATQGSTRWNIDETGNLIPQGTTIDIGIAATSLGPRKLNPRWTNTATVGNVTLNDVSAGRVNIGAGNSSMVLTSNQITANTKILLTLATNDATAKSAVAVAAAGSATITLNAAATGQVAINFLLIS